MPLAFLLVFCYPEYTPIGSTYQEEMSDETHQCLLNRKAGRTPASRGLTGRGSDGRSDPAGRRGLPGMERSHVCPARPHSKKEGQFIPRMNRGGIRGSTSVTKACSFAMLLLTAAQT